MKYLLNRLQINSPKRVLWQNTSPEKDETITEKPVNELEEADIQAETVEAYAEKVKLWLEEPENTKNLTVGEVRDAVKKAAEKLGAITESLQLLMFSEDFAGYIRKVQKNLEWLKFQKAATSVTEIKNSLKKSELPLMEDKILLDYCVAGGTAYSFLPEVESLITEYKSVKNDENFKTYCATGNVYPFLRGIKEYSTEYEFFKEKKNFKELCAKGGSVYFFLKGFREYPTEYELVKNDTEFIKFYGAGGKVYSFLKAIKNYPTEYESVKNDTEFIKLCAAGGQVYSFLNGAKNYPAEYRNVKNDARFIEFCAAGGSVHSFLRGVNTYPAEYESIKNNGNFKKYCAAGEAESFLDGVNAYPTEYQTIKNDTGFIKLCATGGSVGSFLRGVNTYPTEYQTIKNDTGFIKLCATGGQVLYFLGGVKTFPTDYQTVKNDTGFIEFCSASIHVDTFLRGVNTYPTEYQTIKNDTGFIKLCATGGSVGSFLRGVNTYPAEYESIKNNGNFKKYCASGGDIYSFLEGIHEFPKIYEKYKNSGLIRGICNQGSSPEEYLEGLSQYLVKNPRKFTATQEEKILKEAEKTVNENINGNPIERGYLKVLYPGLKYSITSKKEGRAAVTNILDAVSDLQQDRVQKNGETLPADPMAVKAMRTLNLNNVCQAIVRNELNRWQDDNENPISGEERVSGLKEFSAENLYWLMVFGLQEFTGSSSFGLAFDGYGQFDGRMKKRAKNGQFVPLLYQIQMSGKTGSEFLESVDPSGTETNNFLILLASRGYLEKFFLLTNTPEADQNKLFEGLLDSVTTSDKPMNEIIVLREIIQGLNNDTERSIDSTLLDEVIVSANEGKEGIFGIFRGKKKAEAKAELLRILNETKLKILQRIETKVAENYRHLKQSFEKNKDSFDSRETQTIKDQIDALAIFMALYKPGSGEAISETSSLALQEMKTIKAGFEKMLGYDLESFEVKEQSEDFLFRNGVCVNIGLMYNDKDGDGNFASFPQTMKNQGWDIQIPKGYKKRKNAPFLIIEKSNNDPKNPRKIVHLIENPAFSGKGIAAMQKYCEENKLYLNKEGKLDPTMVTHFGHAGNDKRTKQQATDAFANLNFSINRACWGDHLKSEWMNYNESIHNFGTKGTGTRQVADPCMLIHSEMALENGKIVMEDWWNTVEIIFEATPESYPGERKILRKKYNLKRPSKFALEKFLAYVPPHKDQTALVLRLKRRINKQRESTKQDFPYDLTVKK